MLDSGRIDIAPHQSARCPSPILFTSARHWETVMDQSFELVDLGDAKEETRFGHFFMPTDGINLYFV